MDLLLIRKGNSVELIRPGNMELDIRLTESIRSLLSYTYKARTRSGKLEEETRYMCAISDDRKSMCFSFGLFQKTVSFLKSQGHNIWLKTDTDSEKRYDKLVPVLDNITPDKFRPRQEECFQAILNNPCGVVQAPMGFGKTYLLGLLCNAFPNEKIHICTKSVKLVKEIYSRLKKVVDSIGMVGGGKKDLDCRVTVFTADSLDYSDGDAAFLFFDECHTAAAPTYVQKIMYIYKYSRKYGFTATPQGRGDGADALLEMLFGPLIFSMTYDQGVEAGLVSKIKVRWLQCHFYPNKGLNCTSPVFRNRYCIWENENRNKLIAQDVHANYADNTKVLILVSTVAHAFSLQRYLPEFKLNYASIPTETLKDFIKKGWCDDSFKPMNNKDKEQLFQDFLSGKVTKVISTDVWNTGIDVPDLFVVYNVSGRVSKILNTQGAGRASRLFSGKDYGQVVDIRDNCAEYSGFSYSRYNLYRKLGWEQTGFYSDGMTNGTGRIQPKN